MREVKKWNGKENCRKERRIYLKTIDRGVWGTPGKVYALQGGERKKREEGKRSITGGKRIKILGKKRGEKKEDSCFGDRLEEEGLEALDWLGEGKRRRRKGFETGGSGKGRREPPFDSGKGTSKPQRGAQEESERTMSYRRTRLEGQDQSK